ncbi:tRNA1(Val) (adenine(37)-N6)-methyltransferase [Flavobacterium sp. NKUCC04_CG]|uniref:tRNA1(Val) (adenine(37)-N6)-methyltransferase n=1 Tax=Flavobacterium sp. NKUCC04_CG TaxID=2842121 RepID=UPI001C5B7935|nr:methyltransferase [Flavobacterium sp. NKUCC04_CG]MBW3518956.1 methyltransferase [Flavobacterium sp. NKUCC04_CG]
MFRFKQFTIEQDRCAMKVGTDGVVLGAWTPLPQTLYSVLDIGTGTGLIALMLAQRSFAEQIDALEIDDDAYEQAVGNFENSPWSDRLFCYHAGLDEFVDEIEDVYDLIVANPPFYTEDYKTSDEKRDLARFEFALPFEELLKAASIFLAEEGIFSVIIPFKEELHFTELAREKGLFPLKTTRVKGHPTAEIKRSLLAFSRKNTPDTVIDELILEVERHQYTPEFTELVKDFYLKL